MRRWLPPVLLLIALALVLEIGARMDWMNAVLFPPPSLIWATLLELAPDFRQATWETALATAAGFGLSIVFGVSVAIVLSLSRTVREAVLPFAIFFQTVPVIAIAPLLVIYFGFGLGTVVVCSLIVSIFPVLANTLIGLQSVDPGELELFKLYRANAWTTLWKLRVPRAYPSLYAGLKVAAGLAVIGTVAGEFVAGGGLGAMIDSARTQQRIDIVFAALLLLSLLGLALVGFLRWTHFLLNRRRPYGLNLKD